MVLGTNKWHSYYIGQLQKKKKKRKLRIHSDSYSKYFRPHKENSADNPELSPFTKCRKASKALAITTANGEWEMCHAFSGPPGLSSSKFQTHHFQENVSTNTVVQCRVCPRHKMICTAWPPNMHILQWHETTATQDQWRTLCVTVGERRKRGCAKKETKKKKTNNKKNPANFSHSNTLTRTWETWEQLSCPGNIYSTLHNMITQAVSSHDLCKWKAETGKRPALMKKKEQRNM